MGVLGGRVRRIEGVEVVKDGGEMRWEGLEEGKECGGVVVVEGMVSVGERGGRWGTIQGLMLCGE
ncbi:MAG: hypothetical protein OJF49_004699 [Ktedonobacterales bacterium]|nr:MAG: hypothetical protein OJF49_004699 [Ktedonobacterales bacterium]